MIEAHFCIRKSEAEFTVKGHSGFSEEGSDIVCAAVSSACYMAANTVTEILGIKSAAQIDDGYMHFSTGGSETAADIIRGLKLHLEGLMEEYPDFVEVTTEV